MIRNCNVYLISIILLGLLVTTSCNTTPANREINRVEVLSPPTPRPPASENTSSAPEAIHMKITSYDDGYSCPANCDSHVVFKSKHNGTANAFKPASGNNPFSTRNSPNREKCLKGQPCAICFGPETASCLVTTYRGTGPFVDRFDVTPAFLKEWCRRDNLPQALADKCYSHMADAKHLDDKTNCIANPENPRCSTMMKTTIAAKNEDTPRYEQCKSMGEARYNASLSDTSLQREHDCAYFKNRRHSTGNWLLLTPAACRAGYFVGKNGLDCCSADPVQAAVDPGECGIYYR